ncbi:dimethyladenosine transferase [Jatrophihabitans sp. GAS493]|uniref:16S rRNA (adenine(1518)-N(6)/adenine(1519)-N(6))- dimethyltransferase RsmA n=1 Tax=Jatrophihabitans sp. GAS493 TaxID=1907575 RepID=UPI000BB874F5|nr:16S rRNA (adenine(1518)-N(6)/adenine(1519)-N(6))-dimethyltransferase RsmA [Jatrophihabitans sp. GAS493]SOD70341.1 dimethyladenosine transferase [Jatrophihabitans sp. GAS493]
MSQSQLLGPAEIRALAAHLQLRPTKSLGQNFLHDPNTIRRIVRTAALPPDAVVIEVGPGLGSLTLGLLDEAERVVAIEIDPTLARQLPLTVAERAPERAPRLRVITADALQVTEIDGRPPTALVANLPYNVGVPVLLSLLQRFPTLRSALVMVQAEVADRLAAPPGSKVYGVPSVKTAWYGRAERAGAVPRAVFWPVPNVDSGLVRITAHESPPLPDGVTRADVFTVIDLAFSQRRKMLRSVLGEWAGSPARAEEILLAAGVAPTARGETIDVAGFARIASARVG